MNNFGNEVPIETVDDLDEIMRRHDCLKDDYTEYQKECKAAMRILNARLTNLEDTCDEGARNPFVSRSGRIKTFSSTQEKLQRKGYPETIESIRDNIKDVAGIRVVTLFRDDIYRVVRDIEMLPGITIIERIDYIRHPKENGYESYHFVILVENLYRGRLLKTPVEVQVRDKAMDLWASMEHVIRYKPECMPENSEEREEAEAVFSNMKTIIDLFDKQAMNLRDLNLESSRPAQKKAKQPGLAIDPML